jgi:PAS domain S-box-containing protein
MDSKPDGRERAAELRRRATDRALDEARRAGVPLETEAMPPEACRRMLHELRVHQIELEMQNEALRQAQLELEILRSRYFDLYDLAPVGYCTLSEDGLILEAHLCAATLLGMTRSALLKQPILHFVQKEDQDVYYLHRKQLAACKEPQACALRMLKADGTRIWLHLESATACAPSGAVEHRVVLSDITGRKRVEAELIAARQAADNANLAKSRFLAAASHDLRQPIQAISLFNKALVRTGLNAEQKRISEYLSQSVRSLDDLLNALLDISKLDAGIVKPKLEVVPLEKLFAGIHAELSPMAFAKNLRFRLRHPQGTLAISTDRALLLSLLGNLIGNAIKYTEHGGVLVGVRRRGDQALIQVWDTGIGVAQEHMNTIFEEYFQVQNPARNSTKGLGLGLAIVRHLARLLGTEVFCRSRLGKGSVFEFRLPIAQQPVQEMDSRSRHAGRHVILVEDDLMVATAIRLALESFGMCVTRYADAESALADTHVAAADVYITDFRLPGMNGVQFLDSIQQRSASPFQAILLTGGRYVDGTYRNVGKIPLDPVGQAGRSAAPDFDHRSSVFKRLRRKKGFRRGHGRFTRSLVCYPDDCRLKLLFPPFCRFLLLIHLHWFHGLS